jgi:hypothetical protein
LREQHAYGIFDTHRDAGPMCSGSFSILNKRWKHNMVSYEHELDQCSYHFSPEMGSFSATFLGRISPKKCYERGDFVGIKDEFLTR